MERGRPQMAVTIPKDHGYRIGLVKSCFNSEITNAQLESATAILTKHGIPYDVLEVAGCYEIVHGLDRMAASGTYSGLVALGALIKGETIHFEVIANAVGDAVMNLITTHGMPIGFGVITANTTEQATARVEIGHDATVAVLDLLEKRKALKI